jgi:hypothetical protein
MQVQYQYQYRKNKNLRKPHTMFPYRSDMNRDLDAVRGLICLTPFLRQANRSLPRIIARPTTQSHIPQLSRPYANPSPKLVYSATIELIGDPIFPLSIQTFPFQAFSGQRPLSLSLKLLRANANVLFSWRSANYSDQVLPEL